MALEDNQQSQLDSSSVNCECTEIFQLGRKRQTIVAIPIASIKSYKAFCGHWRQQYATKLCNKLSIRGSIDWRKLALVALQSMSELWLPMSWRRLAMAYLANMCASGWPLTCETGKSAAWTQPIYHSLACHRFACSAPSDLEWYCCSKIKQGN